MNYILGVPIQEYSSLHEQINEKKKNDLFRCMLNDYNSWNRKSHSICIETNQLNDE